MEFHLLTLHPDLVEGPLQASILGRAQRAGLFSAVVYDIREHGLGRHKTVDDSPYGGGAGMVMRVDVVVEAIESVRRSESKVFLMSPGGRPLNQDLAQELSREQHVILVCGHYEGIDARVLEHVDGEISLGDFVLTGGSFPPWRWWIPLPACCPECSATPNHPSKSRSPAVDSSTLSTPVPWSFGESRFPRC